MVHVLEPSALTQSEPTGGAHFWRDRLERARKALTAQVEALVPPTVELGTAIVHIDAPRTAILEQAELVAADLIVLGPHRGGAVGAHFFGTTADYVVRRARAPCLVTRNKLSIPLTTIGVPVDFSNHSRAALELAIRLASAPGAGEDSRQSPAELQLLHVSWPLTKLDDPHWEEREIRPAMELMFEEAREAVAGGAVKAEFEIVRDSNPVDAAREWVRRRNIQMLVMGTHGRSGFQRALLGSMSAALARTAPCAVLLVPPTRADPDGGGMHRRRWEPLAAGSAKSPRRNPEREPSGRSR